MDKKLSTGKILTAWNYDVGDREGQAIGVRNGKTGGANILLLIESVCCAEGKKNRIIIKKSVAEKHGFLIIEE